MKDRLRRRAVYRSVFVLFSCLSPLSAWGAELPLGKIRLPEGFSISLFAKDVENARSLAYSPRGTLYVGTREAGKVYAVRDENGDFRADRVATIASGLDMPNGVAFRGGSLYVAEVNRVIRFDGIESRLENPPKAVVVSDRFPSDRAHGWKFIRFGPDGKLYVPIGAPCNACVKTDERYGTITRMAPDGSGFEIYARGVRNSVGFDWHPTTGELWFTDNGRDQLGDDIPPDELNRASRPGLHFGFPYVHGNGILDPELGARGAEGGLDAGGAESYRPPAIPLGPHVAALGMRFYTGSMFPREYRNQIFIAEHGSWNRSVPIGYRITLVRLVDGAASSYETFAEGWLEGRTVWGRPVDIELLPDGSLLLSDDKAGAIYRISYRKG